MEKKQKIILVLAGMLLGLNFVCWREVFVLNQKQELQVEFLNVGQGDSELIITPGGNKILIDGGANSTVLGKLAGNMPFWDRTVDVIIMTHPESDHMTGLLDVLQKYNVKYFLWTGVVKNDAENKKLAQLLNNAKKKRSDFLASIQGFENTKVVYVKAGEIIKSGNVKVDILYPFEDYAGKTVTNTSNDTCVVAKLEYGKNSFLFTGDIDSKAEKELVDSGENIKSNVLKVAHHGSKYSSSGKNTLKLLV